MIQEKPPLPNSEYKNGLDLVENDLHDLKMTLKHQKIIWDEESSNKKSENPDEIIAVHSKSKPTTPRMHETEIKRILTTPSRGKFLTVIWYQMTFTDLNDIRITKTIAVIGHEVTNMDQVNFEKAFDPECNQRT